MQEIEQYIQSTDGTTLFFRMWKPANHPKAAICLVHGLGEHSARYEHWAKLFNNIDIAFCAIDYRGHGRAGGKRGHAWSYSKLYEDVDCLFSETQSHLPNVPIILYGHSLGGNIAFNYFLDRKPKLSGMIITSPWMKLTFPPSKIPLTMGNIFRLVYPGYTVKNGLNSNDLSRDPETAKNYNSDPLVHNLISLKLYYNIVFYGKRIISKGYCLNVPFLLMHGTSDRITFCKSSELFVRNTGKFTTYKFWDNAYHELHNDIIKLEVFDFISNWLRTNFDIN